MVEISTQYCWVRWLSFSILIWLVPETRPNPISQYDWILRCGDCISCYNTYVTEQWFKVQSFYYVFFNRYVVLLLFWYQFPFCICVLISFHFMTMILALIWVWKFDLSLQSFFFDLSCLVIFQCVNICLIFPSHPIYLVHYQL